MRLRILAVGQIKEAWLKAGIAEYSKRLSRFAQVEFKEVADSPDNLDVKRAVHAEGQRLLAAIRPQEFCIALHLGGEQTDSLQMASRLQSWLDRQGGNLTFIIAGSNGFDEAVLARANATLSLSPLTFTHQFTRLILLEQLYRSFKINSGETYHK